MGLVSVLLFDSPPAWNKRRLLYVKLLPPPPPAPLLPRHGWASVAPQILTTSTTLSNFLGFWQLFVKNKNRATFSKKPSPEHPVSDRLKCQAQLVAYGRWSRSRVQTWLCYAYKMVLLLNRNESQINRSKKWTNLTCGFKRSKVRVW